MLATATSTPALAPAIIAAIGAVTSALLLAWVAIRAQSADKQLEQIRRIIQEELRDIADDTGRAALVNERVKKALREVLGQHPRSRRWYDREE